MGERNKVIGIILRGIHLPRFPGKPLAAIGGKSMIQRVYEQAQQCSSLDTVIVATDDERIYGHVLAFGGNAMMTASHHQSGTERCAEVMEHTDTEYDVVLNIQGDEPFIQPQQLDIVIGAFENASTDIATLALPLQPASEIANPNVVKVVFSNQGKALYFSRNVIPFPRHDGAQYFKHIGLYGYRSSILKTIVALPPGMLERTESLEQLRWLENGYTIQVCSTDFAAPGVDTPEDLIKAEEFLQKK
ncbi:MAG: 3-deoxy-manno-octulosonate cytidylyltransferase [Chitinophagales bacterium]